MPQPDLRIGIDVGGTNTDAVVLDRENQVIVKAKRPTTPDVTDGIDAAIQAVLELDGVEGTRITHVMLGTTHATNAVLERRRLQRVAVLRIGAPSTTSVHPLLGWPDDLRAAISVGEQIVGGGIELDGSPIAPLDRDAIDRFFTTNATQTDAVAITGVFSPVSPEQELEAGQIATRVLGDVPVSLSHEIGTLGLLERENATVLNAALTAVAANVTQALAQVLTRRGLEGAAVFLAQNDGTLMSLEYALRYPVLTIGSGPANSIRGAAYLTRSTDALVADVGGTSTDIGALTNGFPRASTRAVDIGGVRTNFRMPDLYTLAVGGGTVVRGNQARAILGPDSVGHELFVRALAYGGETATLTDAAVHGQRLTLGSKTIDGSQAALLNEALALSDALIAEAVDRVKTSRVPVPLVAVGGASALVPELLPGISEILRPEHYEVANAVGAAIAHVSGQVDEVVSFQSAERRATIDRMRDNACARAVSAGADPTTVEIVEHEETPLTYLTAPSVRIRIKASGPLAMAWTMPGASLHPKDPSQQQLTGAHTAGRRP